MEPMDVNGEASGLRSLLPMTPVLLAAPICGAEDPLRVLPDETEGVSPSDMMRVYLERLAREDLDRRDAVCEKLKTPEDLAAHRQHMRAFFIEKLGGFPERTPLNARVVGRDGGDGFRIERIIYESLPGYFVTALCYLPDAPRFPPPFPAVLVLCGHQLKGVGKETYYGHCTLLARNGLAALCIDPIGQGERNQVLTENGESRFHSSLEDMHAGIGSILGGRNVALYFVWDAMRAMDYLETRDDIDARRMGCLGGSGGGTQTAYLMALDDRVKCASPRNYMTSLRRLVETLGPDDLEQDIHAQIAKGMGHGDFILMAAPCPVLLLIGTHDFFDARGAWDTFREAKRAYTRLGIPERVDLIEDDAGHGATDVMLAGLVRWMRRWLQGIDDAEVLGQDALAEPDAPMLCTPRGQVLLLDGARSTFDLNIEAEERLAQERRRFWQSATREAALTRVREVSGIRPLDQLPSPRHRTMATIEREGYCIGSMRGIEKVILEPERGIWLPGLLFLPKNATREPVLYVHGEGKSPDAQPDGPVERLVSEGHPVLAVDLRGLGETQRVGDREDYVEYFGPNWRDSCLAYMLGKSLLAMRAEDILACARFLKDRLAPDSRTAVTVVALGEAGPPALHAMVLEQDLFASLVLRRSLVSWADVVRTPATMNQLTNVIHGVLKWYDLPDLLTLVPPGKVQIHEPLNAAGDPAQLGGVSE